MNPLVKIKRRDAALTAVSSARISTCTLVAIAAVMCTSLPVLADEPPAASKPLESFTEEIPKAAFKIDMVPIPANAEKKIDAIWMSTTEITWDAFDVYVYRLDEDGGGEAVARGTQGATRPTKPYLPPDRGLGHAGFATISISHHNAKTFCDWLSEKTGKHYRLPTEDEWEYAALAGSAGPYSFENEDDAGTYAWFIDNSDSRPRPVGRKTPNAYGLFDINGNVSEWVIGRDGLRTIKGGSYLDGLAEMEVTWRKVYDPAWNAGDPNIPKSKWWLTDAPFIGFRIVCDPKPRPATDPAATPGTPAAPAANPKPDDSTQPAPASSPK